MNLIAPIRKPLSTPEVHATTSVAAPERYNIYVGVHRALRSLMSDTLARVGRLDVTDADEMEGTLSQLEQLLRFCTSHIEHENDFLHTAIEARLPAGAARTAADHLEHCASISALGDEAAALAQAHATERPIRALRLYRHLALFVAENFQHMHVEETANAATLWANYTDAELHEIHDRLLATLSPEEHLLVARWLVPASSPSERAGMLKAMQMRTPPEAFLGVLIHVRPHLAASGWAKLARAVGVPESLGSAT
ncbi:MAG: hypothetical protein ABUL50_07690 [Rhizobacter sp.]